METALKKTSLSLQKGFTLIELLVVIGILAVLMGIVLVAINPGRQLAQAANTKRQNDVRQILNAIGQYTADNAGNLPPQITTSVLNIQNGATNADICALVMPTYISALPADPTQGGGAGITSCTTYNTGYTVVKDASNRVTVAAPSAQLGQTISVTR